MSRERVILKLIPIFRQHGYEGTSLSMLSKATSLGKASLYHYFPQGKQGMANAVMDYVAISFEETVLQPLSDSGTSKQRVYEMCQALSKFYDGGKNNCFLAIMSLGEADSLFHTQVKQRLENWIDALTQALIEAEIEPQLAKKRSQNAVAKIQGALVLVRILDEPEIFTRILERLPEELLQTV